MIHTVQSTRQFRNNCLAAMALLFFLVNLAVRVVLPAKFPDALPFSSGAVALGLARGFLNDAATLPFVLLLPAALLLLPTDGFLRRRIGRIHCQAVLFLFAAVLIFTAFAEYYFWEEFGSRFNFIAVDYLVYSKELTENMVESYPLPLILTAVLILAAGTTGLLWTILRGALPAQSVPLRGRGGWRGAELAGLAALAGFLFLVFTPTIDSRDRYWGDYAKNGVYEIFSAYLNNQLDFRAFYRTMEREEAFTLMRAELAEPSPRFKPASGSSLVRMVGPNPPEKSPNVIIVIMESMGSAWLEHTPNLNALAGAGLSFTNMMSTGTRTVRGLEAVMLSIPPTPGNSIVRRPDNEGLFSLGSVFRRHGYDRHFIYGGIGYFDNMNAFFAGNGYEVVDKFGFGAENKTFSTAWGQCDEDLYAQSLAVADASFAAQRPFHQVLLTTSNHRPFSYPEGRVDPALAGTRRGAVRYSDHAIGEFMREAAQKPWYDNTVFLFVGDHPSSIAGKSDIPADGYGIACIMYGPRFFQPGTVDTLCSQIDVAPTLLAALGWEYRSQFFGSDARRLAAEDGRAWIATYQLLGFRTNDRLVVLRPDGSVELSRLFDRADRVDTVPDPVKEAAADAGAVTRAVASYQCAYDLFAEKRLKDQTVMAFVPALLSQDEREAAREAEESKGPGRENIREGAGNDPRGRAGLAAYMLFAGGGK